MKNLLYFLLGFTIVFGTIINLYADDCYKSFYTNYPLASSYSGNVKTVNSYSFEPPNQLTVGNTGYVYFSNINVSTLYVNTYLWHGDPLNCWGNESNCDGYVGQYYLNSCHSDASITFLESVGVTNSTNKGTTSGCTYNCPDTDNDGLCDICDDAPNDSTIGKDIYIKGYYEINGQTVATLRSSSANSTTYDRMTIHEHDQGAFPGFILGMNMPSSIDEVEFMKGGGKFIAVIEPEKFATVSCVPVTNLDACSRDTICSKTPASQAVSEKVPDNGTTALPTPEQKTNDKPLIPDEINCQSQQSKCNAACDGYANVKLFACEEGKKSECICNSEGKYIYANSWEDLDYTINNTTTNNETINEGNYGTGTANGSWGDETVVGTEGSGFTGEFAYQEGSFDFGEISGHYAQFASKFPFSLRTTLSGIYGNLQGSSAPPVWHYSIFGHSVTINLSSWAELAAKIRSLFALGITVSTILMLIYLYVGVDLRGKK